MKAKSTHRPFARRRWANACAIALLFLTLGAARPLHGQEAEEGATLPAEQDLAARYGALASQVEERYEVSASEAGLLLIPLESQRGVGRIEVAGAEVRVNGERVSRTVLRAWLGDEAEVIVDLAELGAADQRRLFSLPTDDLPAVSPDPSVGPPVAEMGTAPDDPSAVAPAPTPGGEPTVVDVPEPPEPPRATLPRTERLHRIGGQFVAFDDLRIEADESASEAVALVGSVTVDGEVRGDVTAVMGSVYVEGRVTGEVVAVNGDVKLGPEAEVIRGVTAVGGRVDRDPGATVRGAVSEVPFVPGIGVRGRGEEAWWPRVSIGGQRIFSGFWFFFWRLVGVAAFAILVALAALVAPKTVREIATRARQDALKCGLTGIISELLAAPAFAILAAVLLLTCIGILLIPILPILLVAICFAAYAGAAVVIGDALGKRLGRAETGLGLAALLGTLILQSPHILAGLFLSVPGLPSMVGWLTEGVGDIVSFLAFTVGVGGFVLWQLDRRRAKRKAATAGP